MAWHWENVGERKVPVENGYNGINLSILQTFEINGNVKLGTNDKLSKMILPKINSVLAANWEQLFHSIFLL